MDRNLIAAWSKLVGTNAAAGVFQLVGFAVAAQTLNVAALGVIVLIQAYVRVIDGVFNFQSVNVFTRFLAEAEHGRDVDRFRGLIKAGFLVDGATALLATAIAIAVLPLAAPLVGIPEQWTVPGMLFCLVIVTRIFGVSEAVLRCFDQFWTIGLRSTAYGLLLVIGSLASWYQGAGAETFLYVWLVSEAVANLAFIGWTFVVLKRREIKGIRRADAAGAIAGSNGFWPLLWKTNVAFGVRLLSQDADLLIAGGVLGPGAAGLLRAAKNIASIVSQLGRPMQQVASAPISRLSAEGKFQAMLGYAGKIALVSGIASAALAVASIFLGEFALTILFGPEFAAAATALVILLFAAAVLMAGVTLLPLAIAIGESGLFLRATIAGTLVFFGLIALLTKPMGIVGIAFAHLAFNLTWLMTCWLFVLKSARATIKPHDHGPPA